MIFEAELRMTIIVMFSPICECDGACKHHHWNTVERRQHYDPHGWRHIIIVRENDSGQPATSWVGPSILSVSQSHGRTTLTDRSHLKNCDSNVLLALTPRLTSQATSTVTPSSSSRSLHTSVLSDCLPGR